MQMVPIKDLKDTARISRLCHEIGEPVHVTKNGCADMVIMSAEAYEAMESQTGVGRTVDLVREGIDAVSRGECRDALEAIATLRRNFQASENAQSSLSRFRAPRAS